MNPAVNFDLVRDFLQFSRYQQNQKAIKNVIKTNTAKDSPAAATLVDMKSLEKLKQDLIQHQETAQSEMEKLRSDLAAREDKLRQVQSNLLLAEKELDKKFQATGAYANMKKLLVQKNSMIKNLRTKLAQFNISVDDSEGSISSGPAVEATTEDEPPEED